MLGALKAAFRTEQRWNKFCEFVEADKLAQAEAVLDRLKSKADFDKAGDFEVGDLFSTIA